MRAALALLALFARGAIVLAVLSWVVVTARIAPKMPIFGAVLAGIGVVVGVFILFLLKAQNTGLFDGLFTAITNAWTKCKESPAFAGIALVFSIIVGYGTLLMHNKTHPITVQMGNAHKVWYTDIPGTGSQSYYEIPKTEGSAREATFFELGSWYHVSCDYGSKKLPVKPPHLYVPVAGTPSAVQGTEDDLADVLECPKYIGENEWVEITPPEDEKLRIIGVPNDTDQDTPGLREMNHVVVSPQKYFIQAHEVTWAELELVRVQFPV